MSKFFNIEPQTVSREAALVYTIRELLKGGAHEGMCTNEFVNEDGEVEKYPGEGCDIHWGTALAREQMARDLLKDLGYE